MGANLSSLLPHVTAGLAGVLTTWYFLIVAASPSLRGKRTKHTSNSPDANTDSDGFDTMRAAEHSVLRKAILVDKRPKDHAGEVVIVPNPDFDLNKTIFQTIEGTLPRYIMSGKTGVEMFWSDKAADKYTVQAAQLPPAIPHDEGLLQFMLEDCNFFMEHADGSFMDHLQFVYDYSANYFKAQSPRVLLLHSIMGVATNIFPMDVSKEPKLRSMLTDSEMVHVEAFPSVLRCLLNWDLTNELVKLDVERLTKLKSFSFHRCIDNKKVTMTIDDFWVQLNYQLIHLLDFLPASSWKLHENDQLFQVFVELHKFLVRHGKLMAQVDLDLTDAESTMAGQPRTLADMIRRSLPNMVSKAVHLKQIRKFSQKIGHSLDYTLV